jgi:hypothetical protein
MMATFESPIVDRKCLDALEGEVIYRDNNDGTFTLLEVNGAMIGMMSASESSHHTNLSFEGTYIDDMSEEEAEWILSAYEENCGE